jgi:hypothetical protein
MRPPPSARLALVPLTILALLAGGASPAVAASNCKAKLDKRSGLVLVSATVGNDPLWGQIEGAETRQFPTLNDCLSGGKLKRCPIQQSESVFEVAPPATCRVYVSDDTGEGCGAIIPGCTMGIRPFDNVFDAPLAPLMLSNASTDEAAAEFLSASGFAGVLVTQNGTGAALRVETNETAGSPAILSNHYGATNYAGWFENWNPANTSSAIFARSAGTNASIDAEVNHPTDADALFARTTSPSGGSYAGVFIGNVSISGSLSKGGGSFQIDHPLDPERKYLSHSFVESPDMMNVYNGNVTLGADGTAVVGFPDWFSALNRDFRYQLTPIGAPAVPYVAQEMSGNAFTIGGPPGLKVSWQVTGVRQDPWAEAHRIPVESPKPPEEIGTYIHPELYGHSRARGRDEVTRPIQPSPKPELEPER